jgi:tetratricopeptide (TPR) repeat protein
MNEQEIAREQALVLLERAYRHQMEGEFADAILLYKRSIAMFPTAEAHTFLGWTYSMLDRYEEAIEACRQAIAVDPAFGNPYNDIGAYLIEMERWQEAIPWLEKAIIAPRYESPQFPHVNLGRVYEQLGEPYRALGCYGRALEIDPIYLPAERARWALLGKLN